MTVIGFIKSRIKKLPYLRKVFDERDALRGERDNLRDERNNLRNERDILRDERNNLRNERDILRGERDVLRDERNNLRNERDILRGERDILRDERNNLRNERDILRDERNNLRNELDSFKNELGNLKNEIAHPKITPISSIISINGGLFPYENLLPVSSLYSSDVPPERWLQFDNVKMERSLSEYIENDKYPIPSASDREGYFGSRHYHYWLSGLKDYLSIKQTLNKHGYSLGNSSVIFDLGCASGRVLRHFLSQEDNLDLWGADINLRHVEWIRNYLAPALKVFQNTVLPHLPLEDGAFSLVYAFSVFTHVDEFELAWLAEIRRILKKGGFAYLTIHSDNTWKNIELAEPLYNNLIAMNEHIHEYEVTPELFKKPMPAQKTVFKWVTASVYNTDVFHSIDYINSVWGKFFEVIDVIYEGHNYQDVILLRKR